MKAKNVPKAPQGQQKGGRQGQQKGPQGQQGGQGATKSEVVEVVLKLPDLDEEGMDLQGPNDFSNWVLPGRLLMGAYPKRKADLLTLLQAGVTTFINLIHGQELERMEKYGSYFELAKKELTDNKTSYTTKLNQLKYVHIPIYDKQVAPDNVVSDLVTDIQKRLKSGEVVYIHCKGGHGRTGTVVAVFLGKTFGLDAWTALDLSQKIHDYRIDAKKQPGRFQCPETHDQKSQVYKLIDKPT
eukprot:TRINITY_DN2555_c0_g1_i2.p1 TRINITY_DN2555_c0_g1~~TRINITY_DN2555_c0_g1_i2.p1  ORF type:complete len:241 (-),score=59.51 TRINITY_DN2555_c0_g1_i2:17-739(-)